MKLIDWTKVPRGTMTDLGEVLLVKQSAVPYAILFDGEDCREYHIGHLRIVPQTRWTYHDGGECPVPEGLVVDVITRAGDLGCGIGNDSDLSWSDSASDDDIIAYRITGVDRAGGWTDDPSEVTE